MKQNKMKQTKQENNEKEAVLVVTQLHKEMKGGNE